MSRMVIVVPAGISYKNEGTYNSCNVNNINLTAGISYKNEGTYNREPLLANISPLEYHTKMKVLTTLVHNKRHP